MYTGRYYIIIILFLLSQRLGFSQSLVSSGGFSLSNGIHTVDFSLGEIASNFVSSSTSVFTIGFHQPLAFLTAEKKDSLKPVTKDNTLVVYQFLSPNHDGKNETFYVNSLENYPENEVIIMDRTGKTVFYKKNYANDWTGEDLPEDQYFYVVKISSSNIVLKGGLVLAR